jgi:hypothetical protein
VSHITLNDEQARIVAESQRPVELRDSAGKLLAWVWPDVAPDDIAIAKQRLRSNQPRYTTQEVLDHLQSLEQALAALPSSG